ncbi:hypothetical protein A3F66_04915 [candidate division TM6 bacterium RIFCSPHIGHO2_12_FULL_32_22]|nr:MAG: hypothetical protein A3F66_04915 [candidate division TM6 bacterium RIFCSPHIGHO2_12_FULL_32_22]
MAKQETKHLTVAVVLMLTAASWFYGIITGQAATYWMTANLIALLTTGFSAFFLYKHNRKLDNILALFTLITFALCIFAAIIAKHPEYIHMNLDAFWGLFVGSCAATWTLTGAILFFSREH